MSKNTSFILGSHFDEFVRAQIDSGRYANAAEVMRSGLRLLEEYEQKHRALRAALEQGESSGIAGPLDIAKIKRQARKRAGHTP